MKLFYFSMVASVIFGFTNAAQADDALYRSFGEKAGITKIVDDTMHNILADARIAHFFAEVDKEKLKHHLTDQLCVVLEGPCEYSGHTMRKIHAGLEIKEADFNALVEDLQKAMAKNKVSDRAQNKLVARLAPMYRDVIGH
jgi:hemoglobin